MKLTQKQKDDLSAVLDDDIGQFIDGQKIRWRPLLKYVAFWLAMIAIPFVLLEVLSAR